MSSHKIDRKAERVLLGALKVWGVQGGVSCEPDGCALRAAAGKRLRIVRAPAGGWKVFHETRLLGEAAGLPGLLRLLREELAPYSARGRLIVGSALP